MKIAKKTSFIVCASILVMATVGSTQSVVALSGGSGYRAVEQATLRPQAVEGKDFGACLASDREGLVVVGSPGNNTVTGFVSLFTKAGDAWQEQRIESGELGDLFGVSCAFSGERVFVGAPLSQNEGVASGAVHIFRREGEVWEKEQTLLPDEGIASGLFGYSIAVWGDVLAVGAPLEQDKGIQQGRVYVFRLAEGSWIQTQKVVEEEGRQGDWFGFSLGLKEGTLAVAAPLRDEGSKADTGAIFLYGNDGEVSQWKKEAQVAPSGSKENDRFGYSLSLRGDALLAGAPRPFFGADSLSGRAFLFGREDGVWNEKQVFSPSEETAGENFGFSVALQGPLAVIGTFQETAHGDSNGLGAAYIFVESGRGWLFEERVTGKSENDHFGLAVAAAARKGIFEVTIGAPAANDGKGQARVFLLGKCGDLTNDGMLNILDVVTILRIAAGTVESAPLQKILGDVNSDTLIDKQDAAILGEHIVGSGEVTHCGV